MNFEKVWYKLALNIYETQTSTGDNVHSSWAPPVAANGHGYWKALTEGARTCFCGKASQFCFSTRFADQKVVVLEIQAFREAAFRRAFSFGKSLSEGPCTFNESDSAVRLSALLSASLPNRAARAVFDGFCEWRFPIWFCGAVCGVGHLRFTCGSVSRLRYLSRPQKSLFSQKVSRS